MRKLKNIKKKSMRTTIILLFITLSVFSQNEMNFGVKIGANYSRPFNNSVGDPFGINLGFYGEKNLNNEISIIGEVLYNNKKSGGSKVIKHHGYLSSDLTIIDHGYIDFSILFNYKLLKKFSINIGPEIGFLISHNDSYTLSNGPSPSTTTAIHSDEINKIDLNIDAGFNYYFNSDFFINTRYSYGLSNILKNSDYKNGIISLSLNYKFK